MTRFSSPLISELTRKADHDALFVLAISIGVLLGTAGLLFLLILIRIFYTARTAPCSTLFPNSICLVFGKQLVNDRPDRDYIARLERLIDCACKNAILMGGKTPGNHITEALAGLEYLKARGIDASLVHLEQNSQSTLENLRNSRELIGAKNAVIISNRYHLSRCSVLAKSFAIKHTICAAEPEFLLDRSTFAKCLSEAFYIHWFYSGKCWATLTRNQRMLNKIT